MTPQFSPVIIFSVEKKEIPAEVNYSNSSAVKEQLEEQGVRFKQVLGNCDGHQETSFVVLDSPKTKQLVLSLAKKYNQDTVLFLDSSRYAAEYSVPNSSFTAGIPKKWLEISEQEARLVNHTFDPTTGTYFGLLTEN